MDSQKRSKSLESTIAAILLFLLAAFAAAILVRQSNYDIKQYGIDTVVSTESLSTDNKSTSNSKKTGLNLPDQFKPLGPLNTYKADTLYEKINGKAPFYTESGFVELTTQIIGQKGSDEPLMEMYLFDMGKAKNAFSVYSVQRRPDCESLKEFRYGYKTGNSVYLAKNNSYMELIGFTESPDLPEKLVDVAKSVVDKFADVEIKELSYFPDTDLVEDSYKLYLNNAFGFGGMENIYTAKYDNEGESVTVFLSPKENPEQAASHAENYKNFLIENGAKQADIMNKKLSGNNITVLDFYGTTEIIFTSGRFLAGIHEAEEQKSAENLALMLMRKLEKLQ